MSPAFTVAFLLLSATVVKSLEDEAEEEEDFPSHVNQKRADHNAEEVLQDGGLQNVCDGCKTLVAKVKMKMGDKTPKKAEIAKLLDEVCKQEKAEPVEAACKTITGEIKNKVSEALAGGDDPKSVCKKVKLCKKKTRPLYRY